MKVRLGVGPIPVTAAPALSGDDLAGYAREAESRDIDSVWLSDLVSSAATVDPLVGMAYVAAITTRLKVGSGVIVLPGRNPVLVAAQLASLAALAPKRILPTFGLRAALAIDRGAYPVSGSRAEVFDESVTVVRALLEQDTVTFHGRHFHLENVTVGPRPARAPDLWLGGRVPDALDRVGRLADGWLGSFVTPGEAAGCRERIAAAAARAGREIEDDHYGTNLVVADSDEVADAALPPIARRRPDLADPGELVCRGWAQARDQVHRFVEAGITKFVVRPAGAVRSRAEFLDGFAAELMPVQT